MKNSSPNQLSIFKRAWLLVPALAVLIAGYAAYNWRSSVPDGEQALAAVVRRVERDFTDIKHIVPDRLQAQIGNGATSDVVVFDVREKDEFKVSHIPGAKRVSPNIKAIDFMARFGDQIAGKKIVFYCSVGVRSSQLADVLRTSLQKRNVREIYNLKGGIFAWHNKNMSVVDEAGKTDLVHPFNERWGRLVKRADKRAYSPRGSKL